MRNIAICATLLSFLYSQEDRVRPTKTPKKDVESAPVSPSSSIIEGIVKDKTTQEPLAGAYIKVKGTLMGSVSNAQGQFRIATQLLPENAILEISYVGYKTLHVPASQAREILMEEANLTTEEVIISASRVEETIFEAPVTVSRMGLREIQLNAGFNLFQQLGSLKGVDVYYQSISFPVVNTRGFGGASNPRFVQRSDGVEMLAPVFGFGVGLMTSPSEIDVEAMEVTNGPASALYGPNAINGMLDIRTRTARRYPGLSGFTKIGVNHIQSDTSPQPYFQGAIRWAQTIGERFSYKIVAEYLRATDWMAVNYTDQGDYTGAQGTFATPGPQNPGYNGVNTYGDEVRNFFDATTASTVLGTLNGQPHPALWIARTPYRDRDLIDPRIRIQKYLLGMQYFLTDKIELSYRGFLSQGDAVYQAANRNVIRDALFQNHKLELNAPNFFFRVYGCFEDAGKSYDSRFAGIYLNQKAKSPNNWFVSYFEGYQIHNDHQKARAYADTVQVLQALGFLLDPTPLLPRYEPGTERFKQAFQEILSNPNRRALGAGFYDKSAFYHAETQYDFSSLLKNAIQLLIGGNLRLYHVKTKGTLFADFDKPIWTYEWGSFLQASRSFLDKRLKALASVRYDKNRFFEGRFTPRLALIYNWGQNRQNSIRASYQTGFRIPTLQDQMIALDIGFDYVVIGGTSVVQPYYGLDKYAYTPASVKRYRSAIDAAGGLAALSYDNLKAIADTTLQKVDLTLKPEYAQSIELGTRLLLGQKIYLDIDAARMYYQDFLLYRDVVGPKPNYTGDNPKPESFTPLSTNDSTGLAQIYNRTYTYSVPTNISQQVYADYLGVGIEYSISPKVLWTVNYGFASLTLRVAKDASVFPNFNTPRHKLTSSLYVSQLGRWSGSLTFRWVDAFVFDGLVRGPVPSVNWIDAQIGYTLPKLGMQLRLGAQNLLNYKYYQIPGGPRIGGLYYLQITYDPAVLKAK
ncbi:MAG: carboxypeptidase-like regulatory domain-containing protein [Bacteroidia bacterium]